MPLIKYAVLHPWRTLVVCVVGVVVGTAAFYGYTLNSALGAIATEDFNPERARLDISAMTPPTTLPNIVIDIDEPPFTLEDELALIKSNRAEKRDPRDTYPMVFGEPIPDEVFDSYLLIGADASGFLADAIVLALQPTEGGSPIMVSLPRDLYVWNVCKQGFTRLNTGLGGCSGTASGSELMAIMVEDYTGIPIDHLARINFDGFAALIDAMRGITVCVDAPSRDIKAHLEIQDPGCQVVDGATALGWVRSRHMEQLVDEEWVVVGGSDFGRQLRQQDVLFQLAGKAASFSSPGSLVNRTSTVASYVRLDSSWSFGDAVATAWRYRGISKSSVKRFSIGVRDFRSSRGEAVLLPVVTFTEELVEVHPLD